MLAEEISGLMFALLHDYVSHADLQWKRASRAKEIQNIQLGRKKSTMEFNVGFVLKNLRRNGIKKRNTRG